MSGRRRELSTAVYRRPRSAPLPTYLVVPGLHHLGPDDPRLERFCRILAHSGFQVVCPYLPDFLDLRIAPSVADDLETVAAWIGEELTPRCPPTLFSISVGSWPAFEVAARLGDAVDGIVVFGGYRRFEAVARFCVSGSDRSEAPAAHDPLNTPALFLNLLPWLDEGEEERLALQSGWKEMIRQTWGRAQMKLPGRRDEIAHTIARSLPSGAKRTFYVGCGLVPGARDRLEAVLAMHPQAFSFADPGAALSRLRCPVVICHGRDDDVVPYTEALALRTELSPRVPTRCFLTGLYGHTGGQKLRLRAAAREANALLNIAQTLARGGELKQWLAP